MGKQKYIPLFPDHLNHLNESYEKLQHRIDAIDYELENAPKDKGPNPTPAPRGLKIFNPEMRQQREKYLENTREQTIRGFEKYARKNIGSLDEKTQKEISDRLTYQTSKNGFKDYSKTNLREVQDIDKEDKVSMDYMAAQYFSKYHEPDKSVACEKENIDVWSDRYQNMLDSYKGGRLDERTIEVEEPEPEKDY